MTEQAPSEGRSAQADGQVAQADSPAAQADAHAAQAHGRTASTDPGTASGPGGGPAGSAARTTPQGGAGRLLREEQFSAADAVGGWRGILESALPTALFVVLFVTTRDITVAGIAAIAACILAILMRVIQRQRVGSAVGGLLGVAVGAIWAIRSGDGTDFYLPGLAINALTAVVLLVSVLARRPLVGLVAAVFDPRVADWAQDRDAVRTYTRATWMLAGMYLLKLAVQATLYATGQVAALGIAKLVMGLPLFALVVYLVWLMHRALVHRREARTAAAEASAL